MSSSLFPIVSCNPQIKGDVIYSGFLLAIITLLQCCNHRPNTPYFAAKIGLTHKILPPILTPQKRSSYQTLSISLGYILEDGFLVASLRKIIQSMAGAARIAGVKIATGDTKVFLRGAADGIFINTSGIGTIEHEGA